MFPEMQYTYQNRLISKHGLNKVKDQFWRLPSPGFYQDPGIALARMCSIFRRAKPCVMRSKVVSLSSKRSYLKSERG